jgi:hypothetical protein
LGFELSSLPLEPHLQLILVLSFSDKGSYFFSQDQLHTVILLSHFHDYNSSHAPLCLA